MKRHLLPVSLNRMDHIWQSFCWRKRMSFMESPVVRRLQEQQELITDRKNVTTLHNRDLSDMASMTNLETTIKIGCDSSYS